MSERNKIIFREKALRLYLRNQQKIVFLRLVQPKLFPYFWGLLTGLALIAGLAWSTRVPVNVNGVGLIKEADGASPQGPGAVILLLPPDSLGQLRARQKVIVRNPAAEPALVGRIVQVEPTVLSPDAIRQRFALGNVLGGFVKGPAAVAVAQVKVETGGLPLATYSGSNSPINVEVGSRPVLSLIPGLRLFFGERVRR